MANTDLYRISNTRKATDKQVNICNKIINNLSHQYVSGMVPDPSSNVEALVCCAPVLYSMFNFGS